MIMKQVDTSKAVYSLKATTITLVKLSTDTMAVDVYSSGYFCLEFCPTDFGTDYDLKDRNTQFIEACVTVGLRHDSTEMWLDFWYAKEKAKQRPTCPKTYLATPDPVEFCECEVCDQAGYGAGRGSKSGHVYDCICSTCVAWREMQADVFNSRPTPLAPNYRPVGQRDETKDLPF